MAHSKQTPTVYPLTHFHPVKIISGGQTGVDRAALDAAMSLGMDTGGWCPRDRRALDGMIPDHYPLQETRGKGYQTRTRWNVRDADATLILCRDEPSGGTALTIRYCEQLDKPYLVHRLAHGENMSSLGAKARASVSSWLSTHRVQILNVAGPREDHACPIYAHAYAFLLDLLRMQSADAAVREPAAMHQRNPVVRTRYNQTLIYTD